MKTMLDVFMERKPAELEVTGKRQRGGTFYLNLRHGETKTSITLPTTCAPGCENKVVDFTICAAMIAVGLKNDDFEMVRVWIDRQNKTYTLV